MSTRKINQKQIEAVLALPAAKRYDHFIKLVADWQELWGLYNDGWAMAATESGEPVFPMWPAGRICGPLYCGTMDRVFA